MITMPLVLSDNIDRKTQAAHYSSLIRHYFIYYFIFLDLFNRSVHHLVDQVLPYNKKKL